MTDYSGRLRLALQALDENEDTWGTVLNSGVFLLLEDALSGIVSLSLAAAHVTLSTSDGSTDQSRYMILNCTGTLTANRNVIVPEGTDTLRIALGPYARAKVRVGEYPAPARYEHAPLRSPRPAAKTPRQLWDERLMFHGPRFHGIRSLGPIGDDGMFGELEGMADPGPLLDNVGKLIAYWTMEQVGWGEAPLPIGVAKVEYSGPPPEPGVPVPTDMRVTSRDDDFIVGEAVLCRPDGTTWCHIEGWRMHIFHRDELMDPMSRWVEHALAANVEPDGLLLQYERWPGTPTRDLWAHQALRRDERVTYESMTPADRREWLVEVTGVKEAMRHWLRSRHGIASYPVQVDVRPDGDGRWVATSSLVPGAELRVALSRDRWLAALVASADPDAPLAVAVRPVPEGADAEAFAAALAAEVGADSAGPVRHRVLPAGTVGGNEAGPRAVAWVAPDTAESPALPQPDPTAPTEGNQR